MLNRDGRIRIPRAFIYSNLGFKNTYNQEEIFFFLILLVIKTKAAANSLPGNHRQHTQGTEFLCGPTCD